MRHPSIRLRLTVVYAIVLVAACAALLALNYWLLYHRLYVNIQSPTAAEQAQMRIDAVTNPMVQEKVTHLDAEAVRVAELRRRTLLGTAGASVIGLAATALVGLALCWIVAGRMLRPLRTLTATTRRISQDHLDERIALRGPRDELRELADTFDEMVGRLEAAFDSQRRFLADAAHDLRTPLAIVRTGVEVQLAKPDATPEQWRRMAGRILTATGRAERMLDGLLALARSDSGVIAADPHDLALAAASALSEADDEAERCALTVTTDLRPAPVTGDPALLDRLVNNLVYNAIRHNHADGWVSVATDRAPDGAARVTVRNSGAAIPPAEVDRLFEPFQRLSSDRAAAPRGAGQGLGLSIVRSIVRAHSGTLTATPNSEGGLAITVTLPARR